jgi:hypothetical protein
MRTSFVSTIITPHEVFLAATNGTVLYFLYYKVIIQINAKQTKTDDPLVPKRGHFAVKT